VKRIARKRLAQSHRGSVKKPVNKCLLTPGQSYSVDGVASSLRADASTASLNPMRLSVKLMGLARTEV